MADRTQLRAADHNDIADDDPFAELTRIMGFDPRQPARPQQSGTTAAATADDDFDIDLEKELMGEFDADLDGESMPAVAAQAEPEPVIDDEIASSLEQEFRLDEDRFDENMAAGDQEPAAEPEAGIPEETTSEPDFDAAIAQSLESDLADEDIADDDLADEEQGGELSARDDFALEDQDFALEDFSPEGTAEDPEYVADISESSSPVEAYTAPAAPEYTGEQNFDRLFDTAMADVDMDFGARRDQADERHEPAAPADEQTADSEPVADDLEDLVSEHDLLAGDDLVGEDYLVADDDLVAADELPADPASSLDDIRVSADASEDDFDLDFDGALADEAAYESVAPVEAAAPEPAPQPAETQERSLEDELNALLGNMRAGGVAAANESAAVMSRQAPAEEAPASHGGTPSADDAWPEMDVAAPEAVETAGDEVEDVSFGEIETDSVEAPDALQPAIQEAVDIAFDENAFDAAFADAIDLDVNAPAEAAGEDTADSADWQASIPPAPPYAWNRVTPVVPAQPAFEMTSSLEQVESQHESIEDQEAADAEPVTASQAEEMPDVETVDVPERVVALADDLDIPELTFDDQPASAQYDDLESEFTSFLNEMNTTDTTEAIAAPTRGTDYDDEPYGAGFNQGYGDNAGDARGYAHFQTAKISAASAAVASHGPGSEAADSSDELPGSRPFAPDDTYAVDDLDYDPELDDAMTVPGLASTEASQPRRGLYIGAIVGAVVIAGGLGALAFSFGGAGGTDAPVIVKADNAPIKVKPENPGGAVVPNQDNKVYDAVGKGAKPAAPTQKELVTDTEEPVDVAAEKPQSRVVDLSPDAAAPAAKSEDRIDQVVQEADATDSPGIAVTPRKVRTMVVKPDGTLVAREDPTPAAPLVAATEPVDPAPQHVINSVSEPDASDETGALPPATDTSAAMPAAKAAGDQAEPAASARAQSSTTPATVAVAPQRPSDQPVDIVGEVKPDQVASIAPTAAASGAWSMQIASQPTAESAQSTYQDLARRYGGVLSGRDVNIVKAEIAGKGTFYRVRVPAQSRNDAISLCTSYKAAGGNCFVSK